MQLAPQLVFNGNCAEALAFYAKAFDTKVNMQSRYGDAPADHGYVTPPEIAGLILHAQIDMGETVLMLCDNPPSMPYTAGSNFSVAIMFDTAEALKAAFDHLKDGGNVAMEPQATFWSECYAMVTDKFGFTWQLTLKGSDEIAGHR
ncbi:MAG: VOC family protein [Defluviitaleaceae bacterium]|nr:VOC family protein [Defluviitaleaceae bacterium]